MSGRPAARWRTAAAAGAGCALLAVLAGPAGTAHAAGYRYWSFWERSGGGWSYATTGPAATVPDDGDVEGWRFGISPDSAGGLRPRRPVAFAAVCGDVRRPAGRKRVALVLDYGTAADAPPGAAPPARRTACAVLPAAGSAADALAAVARPLRYGAGGLLCAVSGYPASGCGDPVTGAAPGRAAAPSAAPPAAPAGGGPATGVYVGAGVAAALAGAALVTSRRRRRER